ncbi:MAG: hypothetical protein NWF06_10375 [Candidatus Bathyarchaeota archaeon]|nr:hypothetical protein [Candidatus Bathyarchaeum sp.]
MFGLSHRMQVLATIGLIVVFFAFLARLDFVLVARECFDGVYYHLGIIDVNAQWFWMWFVGYPVFGLVFSFTYYAGALDTERNLVYALGIFATVILFAVGQLEDFFWTIVNPEVSAIGLFDDWSVWGWSAENNFCYMLCGGWNNFLHYVWLACFVAVVAAMWCLIFREYD